MLREERERIDVAKVTCFANHQARLGKAASSTETPAALGISSGKRSRGPATVIVETVGRDEIEEVWEEMEELEVGGDSGSEDGRG